MSVQKGKINNQSYNNSQLTLILKGPEYILLYHYHGLPENVFRMQELFGSLPFIKDVNELDHRFPFLVFEFNLVWVLLGVGLEVGRLVAKLQFHLVEVGPLLIFNI